MTSDPILSAETREKIVSNFEFNLRARGNSILDRSDIREHILDQARSILDEVVDSYHGAVGKVGPSAMSPRVEIGASQAIEEVHPAELLQAASVLFETALPFVQRAFSAVRRQGAETRAALVLHRVIMSRIAVRGVFYTEFMLKTIGDSRRAELARLARDLHDHTAHTIGVAVQNLELHDLHADRDPARAQEKLVHARQAMQEALDDVRRLSTELGATVIVLTMHDRPELVRGLLDQGAVAYLVKTIARDELIAAVRSVVSSQGNILLSVSRRTIDQLDKPSSNEVLSARELEVLRLAALAMNNAQIGRQLFIAEGTVKRHLTKIYAKLGAVSRVDAIRKATAARLIPGIDS